MRWHGHRCRPPVCSPRHPRAALYPSVHLARRARRGGAAAQLACLTCELLLLCVLRSITAGVVAAASVILDATPTSPPPQTSPSPAPVATGLSSRLSARPSSRARTRMAISVCSSACSRAAALAATILVATITAALAAATLAARADVARRDGCALARALVRNILYVCSEGATPT